MAFATRWTSEPAVLDLVSLNGTEKAISLLTARKGYCNHIKIAW